MDSLNFHPLVNTGIHTVIITVIAMLYGSVLEKFFANKPDAWVLGQLGLVGIGYDFIRDQYQPDPDAWVAFASALFAAQPSLLPRLKRLLKMG